MELFTLCRCSRLSLLIAAAICMQFAKPGFTNKTNMAPHTLDVLHESLHSGIGPASPLSRNAGNYDLATMVERQTNSAPSRRHLEDENCQLHECYNKRISNCDFRWCQDEDTFSLGNHGLSGTLPANLNTLLPNAGGLWVVAQPEVNLKLLPKLFWSPNFGT